MLTAIIFEKAYLRQHVHLYETLTDSNSLIRGIRRSSVKQGHEYLVPRQSQ